MARLIRAINKSDLISRACENNSAASFALYCSSNATPTLFARYAASRVSNADCSAEVSCDGGIAEEHLTESVPGEIRRVNSARNAKRSTADFMFRTTLLVTYF